MNAHRCANCGVSMFERPLFRTSPLGTDFVGQCAECMRVDNKEIDPELEEITQLVDEARKS